MSKNEERELQDFESNMDEHRQKIFMQLNGFKLNETGDYVYDATLKIPAEDLRNPENENYDPIFASACEKVDALRAATQEGNLNLDESTASVWHYIARANDWTSEGGYAYDDGLETGEMKVLGAGGAKFNTNSEGEQSAGSGMSINPDAIMDTYTEPCNWETYKDDDRKNVAVLVPGEPQWGELPPEEKGGKGDEPIDVPPAEEGGKPRKISGPSILMVPPVNCRPGEVFCGGRCTVISAGVITGQINCICLGACNEVEPGECNGFTYGESEECCQNAKYCSDGTVACGNAQCGSKTADRRPLPREAEWAYDVTVDEAMRHDRDGIQTPWCTPVYKEREFYPNPKFLTNHKKVAGLRNPDFNFSVFILDGFFNNKWKNHCLAPVAENFNKEIIRYSDSEEETYITAEIEELTSIWWDGGSIDHELWRNFRDAYQIGVQPIDLTLNGDSNFVNQVPPHFNDDNMNNGLPCITTNCNEEEKEVPAEPIRYDRWIINVWTTDESSGYEKITEQQYLAEDVGHIRWMIPSHAFQKWYVPYPWMTKYNKAHISTRCDASWSVPTTTTADIVCTFTLQYKHSGYGQTIETTLSLKRSQSQTVITHTFLSENYQSYTIRDAALKDANGTIYPLTLTNLQWYDQPATANTRYYGTYDFVAPDFSENCALPIPSSTD